MGLMMGLTSNGDILPQGLSVGCEQWYTFEVRACGTFFRVPSDRKDSDSPQCRFFLKLPRLF